MTPHEIVALRCPSCGGGITQPSREMPFGAEFRCDHCGITSVLIIDRALVPLSTLQKQGEKVCTVCGRVAQREARFCQEGHALVRKCIKCLTEFAVDHQRCDSCGWVQSVKPGTVEGASLAFDRAVSDLADPSWEVIYDALKVIIAGGGTASREAATAAASAIYNLMTDPSFRQRSLVSDGDYGGNLTEQRCWQALGSLGPAAMPAILSIMSDPSFCRSAGLGEEEGNALIQTLHSLGPAARQAAPILRQRLEEIWTSKWKDRNWDLLFRSLGVVSPEDALALCSRTLEEGGKDDYNKHAVFAAFDLGKAAIPTLEKFCGTFSGSRGRSCKAAISALRNGETCLCLP